MQCKEVESVLSLAGIWRYPGGKGRAVEVAGSLRPLSGSREGGRLVLNSLFSSSWGLQAMGYCHLYTGWTFLLKLNLPKNTLIGTLKGIFPL